MSSIDLLDTDELPPASVESKGERQTAAEPLKAMPGAGDRRGAWGSADALGSALGCSPLSRRRESLQSGALGVTIRRLVNNYAAPHMPFSFTLPCRTNTDSRKS